MIIVDPIDNTVLETIGSDGKVYYSTKDVWPKIREEVLIEKGFKEVTKTKE